MFDIKYLTDKELKEYMDLVEFWLNVCGVEYDYKCLKKFTKEVIKLGMEYMEEMEEQLDMWNLRNYLREKYI